MNSFKNLLIAFSVLFAVFTVILDDGNDRVAIAADRIKLTSLVEPCELIPKNEAESIMGTALQEGKYSENKKVGQKICIYEAENTNSFVFLQISLTQNGFISSNVLSSGQNAKAIYTSIKNAFPDRENISRIGDDAFIATPGIHILVGDYYLAIGAGNIMRNKDKLIKAGDKAVANLRLAQK
ncbi:MAG: hypothetical protein HKP58_19120 [Desulfatitalea sp.]|nr:hypothetical protein [Desulfatitalea sp.]NNK02527.1 hypothetical protein [Desulfatitalea sp.]